MKSEDYFFLLEDWISEILHFRLFEGS